MADDAAHPLRILVVDDFPDAASIACELVALLGHEGRFALDGAGALAILATDFKPDVVILDLGLPDISGYDLAPRIRGLMGARRFVLVALTGWGQATDRARAATAGFDRHYTKPTSLPQIQEILALAGAGAGAAAAAANRDHPA